MGKKKWFFIMLLTLAICSACRSVKYVEVPEYHYRDSVVVRYSRDSVYLHDSVYVNRWKDGDTVYVDKVSVRYVYKNRLRTDTLYIYRTDSVGYPVEVRKDVYQLRWWQRALVWVGAVSLIGVVAIVVWLVRSKCRK